MSFFLSIGKNSFFNRGCSIHEAALIAGGNESKEGRLLVFFTPLNPWGDEIVEKFQGDLSKPRKVHYQTNWEHSQNAVYWIHLARTQEKRQNILANTIACHHCLQGLIRTPSSGSTWPGHRKRDCSFGKHGLTQSSFIIQYRLISSKE